MLRGMTNASEPKEINENKCEKRWYNGSKTIFPVALAALPSALTSSAGGPPVFDWWALGIAYAFIVIPVIVMMEIRQKHKGEPGVSSVRNPAILVLVVALVFGFIPHFFSSAVPQAIIVLTSLIGGIAAAYAANRLPDLEGIRTPDPEDPKALLLMLEHDNADARGEPVPLELQGSDYLSKRDYLALLALLGLLAFWRRRRQ